MSKDLFDPRICANCGERFGKHKDGCKHWRMNPKPVELSELPPELQQLVKNRTTEPTKQTIHLDNCPCCNASAEMLLPKGSTRAFWVSCTGCKLQQRAYTTPEDAAKDWNRRVYKGTNN